MGKKNVNISPFLNTDGQVMHIPTKNKKVMAILEYLITKFETGIIYSEKDVNHIINQWHTFGDYFIIRRLLIDSGLMARTNNGAKYWVCASLNIKSVSKEPSP
ncbi:MAG: hypothetical protein JL56_05335 [Desulfotomaculum sp. BICA1-6]|nr:MAG: hypothetical protein VR67_05225 [Peptococcaceae bacterium BRH_c8a]KJS14376.1 MAG: hypothetical protein VR67_00370 [Peptococcaceae bacterium BRH_c8a]KJS76575.1 MAG: hypothetical protein JL56_05335 [Desulfotomaculum sp. BICA1-6]